MYRVAVIQNESEMLRSGYTNVIPKLKDIKRLSQYSFEMFNVVNILKLFQDGDNHLKNFDSLILTTNATSETVLSVLRKNKDIIAEFIVSGKGIFVASQKKLSISHFDKSKDDGKTLFLPDPYEFYTVARPKIEKDSGEGAISLYNNEEHILLQYPSIVTTKITKFHCEHNEFKKHFYRSHIVPQSNGAFLPIFVDTSYKNVNLRSLLMVNLVPQNGERIVISTIAIDWEFHENLLTNIITYITEGLPKVAFIDNANVKHGDFDFLLTSAKLSKISHEVYDHANNIRKELFNVHNTYIFSPDWKENDIANFLKNIESTMSLRTARKKSYVRVYYFKVIDSILTLTQYSNFSTIDLITDSSVLWVNSKFQNRMWNNSFWTTYDILIMLYENAVDIQSYITPILKDIKRHYAEYSYDGVTGATCGLLELIFLLDKHYQGELEKEGFSNDDIKGMLNWVIEKFKSQSIYDKQTVVLTLSKYHFEIFTENKFGIAYEKFIELLNSVSNIFDSIVTHSETESETDLCRSISLYLIFKNRNEAILESLSVLKKKQSADGKWTNTGRTSHVLVFLLNNFSQLKQISNNVVSIDDLIYNGILYLRSEYNWKNANWDNDIQATAKAIQAIGLYNRHYKYSTQDFFKTLEIESDKIYSATVIHNVSESMRKLRQQSNEMIVEIEALREDNLQLMEKCRVQSEKLENHVEYENVIAKQMIRARTATVIFCSLLVTFVLYLTILYPVRVAQEIRSLDLKGIILGFVVALVLTNIAQRTIDKSEFLKNYNDKKKQKITKK